MIVVADACPVIFLAKLDRLALIKGVFPGSILVPETIRRELVQEAIPLDERRRIDSFLSQCRIETVQTRRFASSSLSRADRHVLALAERHPRSLILTDDALVRRIALAERRAVAGTLGLLIRAAAATLITNQEARLAL